MHQYEALKSDIKTYENNLGFLTSSSQKGNSLVTELNRKVEKLKVDLQLVLNKIKLIDHPNSVEKEEVNSEDEEIQQTNETVDAEVNENKE